MEESKMENKFFRRNLIIGIIILLIGASIVPVIGTKELNIRSSVKESSIVKSNPEISLTSDWCRDCDIIVPDNFSTIQEAIDAANPGEYICVRNGTYYENIKIEGHNKDGITLCGEDRYATIINGSLNNDSTVTIINSDRVTISSFNITNSSHYYYWADDYKYYRFQGILIDSSDDIVIIDNFIYYNSNGISSMNTDDCLIQDNEIIGNWDNGIRVSHDSTGSKIRENYIAENGREEVGNNGDGIEIYDAITLIEIEDNIIFNNNIDGIWIDGGTHDNIFGNTISYNGNGGIHAQGGAEIDIKRNIINNNKWGINLYDDSVNYEIFHNEIFDNDDDGIYLIECDDNIIFNNTIFGHPDSGIELYKAKDNEIKHNEITGNSVGIGLTSTDRNKIKVNNITDNTKYGIGLLNADEVIKWNNILNNHQFGLLAWFSFADARYNWWGSRIPDVRAVFSFVFMYPVATSAIYPPFYPNPCSLNK
jgi:parallel beta-helix repeat protein